MYSDVGVVNHVPRYTPTLFQEIIKKKTRIFLESYKPLSQCCSIEKGIDSSDLPWLTYVILWGHWLGVCVLVPTDHPLGPRVSSLLLICKNQAMIRLIGYNLKDLISLRGSSTKNIKSIEPMQEADSEIICIDQILLILVF